MLCLLTYVFIIVIVRFSNRVMSAYYLLVRARVREMVLRYSPMYSSNSWPTAHRHRIFLDATAVLLVDRADGSGGSGTIDDDDGGDDDDDDGGNDDDDDDGDCNSSR